MLAGLAGFAAVVAAAFARWVAGRIRAVVAGRIAGATARWVDGRGGTWIATALFIAALLVDAAQEVGVIVRAEGARGLRGAARNSSATTLGSENQPHDRPDDGDSDDGDGPDESRHETGTG